MGAMTSGLKVYSSIDHAADVCVVLPTFNPSREQLSLALNSIACQTHLPAEIIIVDDASTVEPPENAIPEPIRCRTHILQMKSNRGPSAARNAGVAAASQRTIAFLDQDDIWHPDVVLQHCVFRDQLHALASSVGAFSCNSTSIVNRGLPEDDRLTFSMIAQSTAIHTMSAFAVERDTYNAIGGLNEQLWVCMDLDFYLRFLQKHTI